MTPVGTGGRAGSQFRGGAGTGRVFRGLRGIVVLAAAGAAAGSAGVALAAEAYPARPIRLVIPFAPGGGVEAIGRQLGAKLAESLGQPLVIDNRGGAGGTLGTAIVARSAPDGYTLLKTLSGITIAPALNAKLPYDVTRDFAPVTTIRRAAYLLVAHPSVPAKSVQELIALAKAKPGTLNFASNGVGTDQHMAGELLKVMAGIDIVHVPYTGSGPASTAMLGGQVQLMFLPASFGIPHVTSGRLRGLAVSSAKRSASVLPDLPTIAESGVPGFEADVWSGILAPAGTPRAIIDRLNRAFAEALAAPDTRKFLADRLVEPIPGPPEAFAARLRTDLAKWHDVVRRAGVKGE